MISYNEAKQYVIGSHKVRIDLGLERMMVLLEKLGNPQQLLKMVHIAGTNGKGSTLNYMSSIFRQAGYNVGLYTSPYVHKPNEQIQMNDNAITDEMFVKCVELVMPVVDQMEQSTLGRPSEFEIMTALAFIYFSIQNPNILLIETGLGGRLDATNVIVPLVSIITNVGHDHMQFLGESLTEIAKEKAGIVKHGIPVISGCKQQDVKKIIKEVATSKRTDLVELGEDFSIEESNESFAFQSGSIHIPNIKLKMMGHHQRENAALAISAIQLLINRYDYRISENHIREGLRETIVQNRIEVIQEKPTLIFDGGHNPEGIKALVEAMKDHYRDRNIYVLFCAMKDKKINEMLMLLQTIANKITLTTFPYARAMDPFEVKKNVRSEKVVVIDDWEQAFTKQLKELLQDDVMIVTGSLYFLNEVRKKLNK